MTSISRAIYRVRPKDQVLHRNLVFHRVSAAIKRPLPQTTQIQHCFTKGFAGDRAGIDAHPADRTLALDHGNLLAHFGSADSSFLSCGAAPNDNEVVRVIAAYCVVHRRGTTPFAACNAYLTCQESVLQ
jgi:hypothetical protein